MSKKGYGLIQFLCATSIVLLLFAFSIPIASRILQKVKVTSMFIELKNTQVFNNPHNEKYKKKLDELIKHAWHLQLEKRNYKEAERTFNKIIEEYEPKNSKARYGYFCALARQFKEKEALEEFAKIDDEQLKPLENPEYREEVISCIELLPIVIDNESNEGQDEY